MVNRPEAELKQRAREILKKYRLANERQKYIQSLRAGARISTFLVSPHPADESKALKDNVEALKEKQTSIQRDLQEIKGLLRQRPTSAAPAQVVVLSVDGAPFKGKKDARVTLIDFTDYHNDPSAAGTSVRRTHSSTRSTSRRGRSSTSSATFHSNPSTRWP